MAVHVVQGRDPWWSSLAVNVLGGLFNDWQQREKNKKEAVYLGELAKMYNDMQNGQNDAVPTQTPTPAQDTGQGLLNMNMPVPDGYNDNGWANAFHKNESPLLQFDLGTAGLAPTTPTTTSAPATNAPINAWANALSNSGNALAQFDANTAGLVSPTVQTNPTATAQPAQAQSRGIPTPMDFYRAALELAGTKRFRMLSPDRVQAMLTPYMKINEEARQEQMRNNLADDYMNATDGAGRIKTVTGGALRGIVPESMANTVFNQNKPTVSTVDTGGQILFNNIDPMTGMPINTWAVDRTLTPQQQLDNQFRMLQHEAQVAQQKAQMDYNYANLRQQGDLERQRMNMESNSVTGQIYTGNDGHQYVLRKNAPPIKLSEVPGLTPAQTKILETHENNLRRIATEKERLQIYKGQLINKGIPSDDPEMIGINKRLQEIETQEKNIKGDISNILQSVSTGQQGQTGQPTANNDTKLVGSDMDIGANMLGIENPTITTHFNAPRKKKDGISYGHAGVDYAMPKDHPIRMADVGTTMRVTKVANEPSGYGNYVEAQGELTGADGNKHTISIRWAHMGNGTVNVTKGQEIRFGDLIGKVGNTGNSRGKNGGYHLHLETRIDGKLVDPTNFTRLIAPYIAYSKTNNPNTFTGVTPPPKATVIGRQNETTVAYRNPRTGNSMSQSEVEEFERRADNGELKYARNKEELREYWRKNGYIPTGSYNANNTQGQGQPANGNIAPKPRNIDRDVTPDMASIQLMPPPLLGVANDPHYINVPATNTSTNFATSTPQQPTANSSITDPENEAQSKKALAALNALDVQYNTWDDIYHNRYPFPSMSNFGRV